MKLKITLLIIFILNFIVIFGQNEITGRVIGENFEIPIMVKIFDKDTTLIGKADSNGYFKLKLKKNTNKLIFTGLESEWTKIIIPENCKKLEIILLNEISYDYKSNKKIDRLRKKRFKKLPELYFQAYKNGLFETKTPCFVQEFEPNKSELDRIKKQMKWTKKKIKQTFKKLTIGDTIQIPYSPRFGSDGTQRTTLNEWSSFTNKTKFKCIIRGIILEKNKKKGYNLIYKVIDINKCKYKSLIYNGKEIKNGKIIEYDMKYSKIITE